MLENREVKSDVFSMLMDNKEYALQVYNAVNDSNYVDPDIVEVTTLKKGISLSIRNDASIIVDMNLNIYEHQSTYSPNMPLRSLVYLVSILKPMLKDKDLFGRKMVKIPTPKFVVMYNGIEDRPLYEELRLSNAFEHITSEPQLELVVSVYNINSDKNKDFLNKCKVLSEYATFVEKIREYETNGISESIKAAIEWCISSNILAEFLKEHESEVIKAMDIDMTFERREALIRRDEREDGIAIGELNARRDSIIELLTENGSISESLKSKIEAIDDLDKLKSLLKLASKAESVDDFEQKM